MDSEGCVYGLEHQARCLRAQLSESDRTRFYVGTQILKEANELRLLDFDEDDNVITSQRYPHQHEIRAMAPSPLDAEHIITTWKNGCNPTSSTLWRMSAPEIEENGRLKNKSVGTLDPITQLETDDTGDVFDVMWEPLRSESTAALVNGHSIKIYSLNGSDSRASPSSIIHIPTPDEQEPRSISRAAWDPHNTDLFAVAKRSDVYGWDTRSKSVSYHIRKAHAGIVRDLSFNSNKPHQLATSGDDCKVRFWDTRNCETPIKEISNHSHWVWSISFNHFHDQMFISSGSDCMVNLHSVVSISSAPRSDDSSEDEDGDSRLADSRDEFGEKPTDGVIAVYEQHEDSVYVCEWSAADPWIFASLSYDGRIAINVVPREHKYKVIL
ncbi:protein TSSC1 [Phlyctochytrium arcticum]|nr:protein TSSC1 [Phlyctochytrium arcticum]